MRRSPVLLAALLIALGSSSLVEGASWQSSTNLEGVRLCVRDKNARDDYVAEAKFAVTTQRGKTFLGSIWVHGNGFACLSFPEQFNRPSPAQAEYLAGKFKWSVAVENAVVRSGEFYFGSP